MDLLKELALRGKMIFVVIHQPSSDIFKMFDTLIILDVGGFQIYYGNAVESVSYFQEIINAATKTPGACPECGNINPEQVFNIIETRVVNEFGRFTNTRKISPGQWYQYFKQKIKVPRIEQVRDPLPVTAKIPHWFKQLSVFIKRDVLSKVANHQYMAVNFSLSPLLALFMAYFVKYYAVIGIESPQYKFYYNDNIPVYFFMSVVVAFFVGLIVSSEEIFRDRKILKREKFLHLSRSSYLISKVIILFTLSAVQTITFILVGNYILEIPLSEMRYWWILFSCSCFANVLGLNISSAFDSAVTIYILIPVLVIPQLIMSGVVVSFDKFNPRVGKPNGIPLAGEIMASRWAFEAFMVTQFRDNPYEKQFYEFDQKEYEAEYKRTFFVPALETKLSYVVGLPDQWNNANNEKVVKSFDLLRNEITVELKRIGRLDKFPELENLQVGKFDSATWDSTRVFLRRLKRLYMNRADDARTKRALIMASLIDTPDKKQQFEALRLRYVNKAVNDWVSNKNEVAQSVEWNGQLVQKFYPIYFKDHRPRYYFDFQAIFFVPTKYFMGRTIDTFYFNLGAIWVMTIILYGLLYFDVLKRLVHGFETRRKYRKKNLMN